MPSGPLDRHTNTPVELKARLEAERADVVFLVYRDADGRQRILQLVGERLTIGRGLGADLRLEWDDQVSRMHAELERVGDTWAVADDGLSTNGTFCNEERVRGRRRLVDSDQLRFGRTLVAFRAPALSDDGDTTRVPDSDASGVMLSDTQRRVLTALCRPRFDNPFATPATNQQIAGEVFLGVDAVKLHLRALYRKLGIEGLPHNQKRARLVELAFQHWDLR